MTIEEARVLIHEELGKQPSLTAQDLGERTGIAVMMCYKVLKADVESGDVAMEIIDEMKHYTLTVSETEANEQPVSEPEPLEQEDNEVSSTVVVQSSGRDTTKFIFKKKAYSKSGCVLAVVTDYVNTSKPTLEQLKAGFPDAIVGRFGVINSLEKAKELSPDRARYFMKDDQLLTTSDNITVAVCNQWTLGRFAEFMNAAGKLGYKISPEKI